jgi:type IV secretion system protein VirB8
MRRDALMSVVPTADEAPDAFAANRGWEVDVAMRARRSERRAWRVAGAGVVIGLLGVAAAAASGPLRQVLPVPIVVDRVTGATHVEQRLSVESVPPMVVLDQHNLSRYVRARERYTWQFAQTDADTVARMTTPAAFAPFARDTEGTNSRANRLKRKTDWRIAIISVRPSNSSQPGRQGEAVVTYDKEEYDIERQVTSATTRHVATVTYEYQPKVIVREEDRIENPFGFLVTAYRTDQEFTPANVTGTAGKVSTP